MEEMNKNSEIIATLKAEFVNEFEFTPTFKRTGYRFSRETNEIEHPYTSYYEAKVSVKVGNTVGQIAVPWHQTLLTIVIDSNSRRLTRALTQVVVLGPTSFTSLNYLNFFNRGCMKRKDSLYADTTTDLSYAKVA